MSTVYIRFFLIPLFILQIGIFATTSLAQPVIKIDSTFNKIGYHSINLSSGSYIVQGGDNILVNPADQKYIVRGWANPYGAYLKYNRDGSLDTNFNKTGALVQPNSERYVRNFFFDSNGRLVNAVAKTTLNLEMGFMRTLPSGIPDSTFGTNGINYILNSSMANGYFLPLSNGKFLMVSNYGYGQYNDTVGIKLQQFKSYYALDSSFGVNGSIIYKPGFYDLYIRKVQVFDDGKILISGTSRSSIPGIPYDYDALMMRCLPDGSLDMSFGKNGFLMPYAKNSLDDHFFGSYILPDKKIIGYGNEDGYGFIARYQYDGSIDSSFGFLGRVFIPEVEFYNLQQQRDGKFIGAGYGGYAIARITEDGARDANFGTNGVYQSPAPLNLGFPFAGLLENDSTFLITGNAFDNNQGNNITTARYKIRFQPLVTGVKSRYCFGYNGSGAIINPPLPGSDTSVTVLLDKTTVLPVNPQGQFSFSAGVAGTHTITVTFTKGTNTWNETITFITGTTQPVSITTAPQTICQDGPSLIISANTACYWQGNGLSVKAPISGIQFNPAGLSGPQQIIAMRDNGGCKATMDTLTIEILQMQPVTIAENTHVLSIPLQSGATCQWYLNDTIIPGAANAQYTPAKNGNYTVTETIMPCSQKSPVYTVSWFATPVPVPVPIISIAKIYCNNSTLQKAKLLNPPSAASISVSIDGASTPYYSDSTFYLNVNSNGNHTVTVKYTSSSDNKRKDTSYIVNPIPATGPVPTSSGNKLSISIAANAYQWYRNGAIITGATAREYTISQSGLYAYSYAINGCFSPLSPALNCVFTAITDPATNQQVLITPNPAKEHLYISGLSEQYYYQVQIIDLHGIQVKELLISRQNQMDVYIGNLSKGFYLIRLRNMTKKTDVGIEKIEVL